MQTLNKDIANHKLKQVYLLYGDESYLIRTYKKRLREATVGEDTMNYTYSEGKDIVFSEVKDAVEAMPFFGECRLVMLENTGIFKSASQGWDTLLEQIPETTYVVFVEKEVDKRNKLFKLVSKTGYAAELSHPSPRQLEDWAGKMLQNMNRMIEPDALSLFAQMCCDSMERMQTELVKLSDYSMDHDVITVSDVEAITTPHVANRIFDMIEYVAAGREREALELYYDLAALHEESMRIHYLIARHFNQLLMVKNMMDAKNTKEAIAAKLKMAPFIVGKLMRQAKAFTAVQLKEYLTLCVNYDQAIKTGNLNPKLSVELLIITISRREGLLDSV